MRGRIERLRHHQRREKLRCLSEIPSGLRGQSLPHGGLGHFLFFQILHVTDASLVAPGQRRRQQEQEA